MDSWEMGAGRKQNRTKGVILVFGARKGDNLELI